MNNLKLGNEWTSRKQDAQGEEGGEHPVTIDSNLWLANTNTDTNTDKIQIYYRHKYR